MELPDTASIKFNHFQMFDMGKKVEHIPYETREEAPPVPISNTAVKLFIADGTSPAAEWESRTPPGINILPL